MGNPLFKSFNTVSTRFSCQLLILELGLMIYLDNNSTTKVDPYVLSSMNKVYSEDYGNAASDTHLPGFQAREEIESARLLISDFFDSHSQEVIFT